jgi:hypothetical protein
MNSITDLLSHQFLMMIFPCYFFVAQSITNILVVGYFVPRWAGSKTWPAPRTSVCVVLATAKRSDGLRDEWPDKKRGDSARLHHHGGDETTESEVGCRQQLLPDGNRQPMSGAAESLCDKRPGEITKTGVDPRRRGPQRPAWK